jgi:hypothetical protein
MAEAFFNFFRNMWDDDISDIENASDTDSETRVGDYDIERDAPDNVRPRRLLKLPHWLPLTPTKSHQAPPPRIRRKINYFTRKCPHCSGQMKVNLKTWRVTKPNPRPRAPKKAAQQSPDVRTKTKANRSKRDVPTTTRLRPNRRVKYTR